MHNAINWFEIPVQNIDRAASLYGKLLGKPLKLEVFERVPMAVFAHGEEPAVGGALIQDPQRKSGPGAIVYLSAPDGVGACLARANEAGAKTVQPVTSIGPMGWIALFEDPDGNVVGLHAMQA